MLAARRRRDVVDMRLELTAVAVPPQVGLQCRDAGGIPPVQLRAVARELLPACIHGLIIQKEGNLAHWWPPRSLASRAGHAWTRAVAGIDDRRKGCDAWLEGG